MAEKCKSNPQRIFTFFDYLLPFLVIFSFFTGALFFYWQVGEQKPPLSLDLTTISTFSGVMFFLCIIVSLARPRPQAMIKDAYFSAVWASLMIILFVNATPEGYLYFHSENPIIIAITLFIAGALLLNSRLFVEFKEKGDTPLIRDLRNLRG